MEKKSFQSISKIISYLVGVIFFALLIFTVVSGYMVSQNRVPKVFGYGILRVVSGSMVPEIPVGACIIVKETEPDKLKTGDIISFYSADPLLKEMPNTHRITAKKSDGSFVTRGDANSTDDDYAVVTDKLIGKVVGRAKLFEVISGLLSNKIIFFGLIILPIIVMCIYEIVMLIRRKDSD